MRISQRLRNTLFGIVGLCAFVPVARHVHAQMLQPAHAGMNEDLHMEMTPAKLGDRR